MVFSLYCMVISFVLYIKLPEYGYENASCVALWVGTAFFWIADFCYSKLKDKIKGQKEEWENIERANRSLNKNDN